MKRILIINRTNTDNLGDQAISQSMIKLFKDGECSVEVQDLITIRKAHSIGHKNRHNASPKKFAIFLYKKFTSLPFIYKLTWLVKNKSLFNVIRRGGYVRPYYFWRWRIMPV